MTRYFARSKEDPYICLLRWARKDLENKHTIEEMQEHLRKQGHNVDDGHAELLYRSTFGHATGAYLEMDAYFHLLEYTELQSARQSSLVATCFATVALVVSIFTGVASCRSSNNPTRLAPYQLATLTQPLPGEASIEAKLDELIRVHNDLLLAVVEDSAEEQAR